MNLDQIELIKHRIGKAQSRIQVAELCLTSNHLLESGTNIYYSALDCTRALLDAVTLDSKTHQGIIYLLNENFIRPGIMDKEFGAILADSLRIRLKSDYVDFYVIEKESIVEMIQQAKLLFEEVKRILKVHYFIDVD